MINMQGQVSPLAYIEQKIVDIVVRMARIRQYLTPSQGLNIVNCVIQGTERQKALIEWKRSNLCSTDEEALGKVGIGYWHNFIKLKGHNRCWKTGQTFELDRSSWSTYSNFNYMYSKIVKDMEDAGVAEHLPESVWMDCEGNIVEEGKSFGCKVTHRRTHPDVGILFDELGGNISQKGDGHVGGQLML